jgi:cysteine desulfurase
MDTRVLEAMIPYFVEHFGNAGSINHLYGWEAESAIKLARQTLAEAIGASPEEIIFTSGATEANNLALKGVAESYFSQGRHIITVATEHRAILDPCQYLENLGFQVTLLPVKPDGLIDLEELEKALREDTILVSVMAANNEIGVLQPLVAIGEICRRHNVLFHSDAAQAWGKIPLNVETMNLDLMSLTAHKVYGPKGIGALYVRRRNPKVRLAPQMHGGGQERGLRAGTLYTPQIVGLAKAVSLALDELETEAVRQIQLRERLWDKLSQLEGIHRNGHWQQRLPGNLNVSVEGVDGSALLLGMTSLVALSSGSACSSSSRTPSHVLKALGHSDSLAYASLRFGLGRFNTSDEIEQAGDLAIATIVSLRRAWS